MLFSDSYKTLASSGEALIKEKGSKFLAFAKPLKSEAEFKQWLQIIKQEYPDATHHCYGLILHPDKSFQKCSDDGEPNNTAGKPILRALLSNELTNAGIVVVRYFGGTMLGVPGLISAYHQAALAVISTIPYQVVEIEERFVLRCNFVNEGEAHRFLKILEAKIIETQYDEKLEIKFSIPKSKLNQMKGLMEKFYLLEIKSIE